jgi:calcium-dependent protein kinase
MRCIFQGLEHIQLEMDLVHRDLKPSNIVIQKLSDLETVKIVDFGLAVSIKSRVELMSTCGTLIY